MRDKINIPVIAFLTVLLFSAGLYLYEPFLKILLPDAPNFRFVVTHANTVLTQSIFFGMALGLIPIIFSIVILVGKIDKSKKVRLWLILFLFEVLALIFRCYMILSTLEEEQKIVAETVLYVELEKLLFGPYMMGGLLIGGLLSLRFFGWRKNLIVPEPKVPKKNPQNHKPKDIPE